MADLGWLSLLGEEVQTQTAAGLGLDRWQRWLGDED